MLMRHVLSLTFVFVFISAVAARSEELNAEQTHDLLLRAPWQIQTGGEVNYFVWRADGTLCVRMFDPEAESCDDSGSWERDGAKVCYSLPWWGKGVEINELCFQVVKAAGDTYQAKDQSGLTALTFTLAASD